MEKVVCKHCKNQTFFEEDKGQHRGIYCAHCGKWVKWVKKDNLYSLQATGQLVRKPETFATVVAAVVPPVCNQGITGADIGVDVGVVDAQGFVAVGGNALVVSPVVPPSVSTPDLSKQGCLICKDDRLRGMYCGGNVQVLRGALVLSKPQEGIVNYQYGAEVKYCPVCGRKLCSDVEKE